MNLPKKMCCISAKDINCEDTVEHIVESEITLPEYFPDIVSVLRSTLRPNVSQTKLQSGKLIIEGTALISIIYICDEKKLHCFEQRIPFTKSIEVSKSENCYAVSDVQTQFVNCRLLSQRKLSIHSSLSINYKLCCKKTRQILTDCEENSVQMKKSINKATVLRDCQVKSFVINETLELGSAQDSIGQIVRSDAVAILDSVKMVSGKALIKGELKVKVTYLTEKECEIERVEGTMPISQIVEIDSQEDSLEYVALNVISVDVFAKTDSSGALRMFDLSVCINAELDIYDESDVECIADSYSTEYELSQKKEIISFVKLSEKISENYLCTGSIDFFEEKIKSVLDINCRNIIYSAQIVNNELCINGTLGISGVLLKEDEEIISADKEIDFEYKCKVNGKNINQYSKFNVILSSMNYLISDESKLEIRAELEINGIIFETYDREILTDISVDDSAVKSKNSASLTIYFSEAGESIWNIAKRYNTTVKAIIDENNLNDDTVKEKTKLLIPCK